MVYMMNQNGLIKSQKNIKPIKQIIDIDNLDVEIDQAIDAFDEPYYDPSIVPSYLLSEQYLNIIKLQFQEMVETNLEDIKEFLKL